MKSRDSSIVAMVSLAAVVALNASTVHAAQWGFTVYKQNMAMDPSSGDTIRVTGAGLFDDVTAAVSGHGAYSITDATDHVTERGTWVATEFGHFTSEGGLNRGSQGGVLDITVTLVPNGGSPETPVPMTIICDFNPATGFDEANDATLVGSFSEKIGDGDTVFRLIRP